MVIALLVFLAATVATGIVAYREEGKGPLATVMVTGTTADTASVREGEGKAPKIPLASCMVCSPTSPWRLWALTSSGWR
jgi:hypothetical protein